MPRPEQIQDAITRLESLIPVNLLLQDDNKLKSAANGILAAAKIDWHAVNGKLFPAIDPANPDVDPLDSIDFADADFLKLWPKIRQGQQQEIIDLIAASAPDQPTIELDTPLIKVTAVNPSVWGFPEYDVTDILTDVFGSPFSRHGVSSIASNADFFPREAKMFYIAQNLKASFANSLIDGLYLYGSVTTNQDTINLLVQNLHRYQSVSRTANVQKFTRLWDAYWASKDAYADPHSAEKVAARNQKLADSITERIERHRLKQDASNGLAVFKAHGILGRRAKASNASRTWGIELEITDAGRIMYDQAGGWSRLRDQSLRQQIGDGKMYDPWEFTSPILHHTYSDGLWMICDQAKNTVRYWRAGVHVHVSARQRVRKDRKWVEGPNMTTAQVSRLLEAYSVSAKYIDQIIQRTKREFCVPIRTDQWVKGWLPRPQGKGNHPRNPNTHQVTDAVANARKWAQITHGPNHDTEPTEWKRHQEVNLQALNKYGTIEFRAMGAVYDYEQLVTWAWLCREMVNFAQSDTPLTGLYAAENMDEFMDFWEHVAVEKLSRKKVKNHVRNHSNQSVTA